MANTRKRLLARNFQPLALLATKQETMKEVLAEVYKDKQILRRRK